MIKPCVIGLGYVGLPILIGLSKQYLSTGFDINKKRINDLNNGKDIFNEVKKKDFTNKNIKFTHSIKSARNSNLFIVTVPTPIYKNKNPDLGHLKNVCEKLSKILKHNDIIIFESTVYPGVTNNYCIPLLEKNKSSLVEGEDFFVGYSPERVNPGDKNHNLKKIDKILAYPHKFKKNELVKLYSLVGKKIILSKNIKEAETAKVIENIQRDVNIGLINEIYLVCKKLKLNFNNIINLASTKWNFKKFSPGLVGGHCLPVDPYYFAYISKKNNFNTKITLAGRYINDSMVDTATNEIIDQIKKLNIKKNSKILLCGLSYKKNVADLRNSLAIKIYHNLKKKYKNIKGYDPLINNEITKKNKFMISKDKFYDFDVYVLITKHTKLIKEIKNIKKNSKVFNIF